MLAIVASIQSVQDLIEFSLGTEGRWYIKYREGGRVKRSMSYRSCELPKHRSPDIMTRTLQKLVV